eukprot:1365005-Heterocapsa_arctica.AAC.1
MPASPPAGLSPSAPAAAAGTARSGALFLDPILPGVHVSCPLARTTQALPPGRRPGSTRYAAALFSSLLLLLSLLCGPVLIGYLCQPR